MEFLYILEKIRMPGLNEFMLLITQLGEETAFLAVALILFWCVDKHKGYLLMAVGFGGIIINQFLKLIYRVPRPWVLDENFTILEQAREAAAGYSFPSGHTQTAVGTFGTLAATTDRKKLAGICWILAFLVAFSRMYIGVHTPKDVLVSIIIAVALIYSLRGPVLHRTEKTMPILISALLLTALGLLFYVKLWNFPADTDSHNLLSGVKNAYTMLGCLLGIAVVYPLERRFVKFETTAVWWAQILKVILGLGLVLLVKEGLRSPLEAIFRMDIMLARAVRYFLIVFAAGVLWPLSFRWFSKLGGRK